MADHTHIQWYNIVTFKLVFAANGCSGVKGELHPDTAGTVVCIVENSMGRMLLCALPVIG